MKAECLQRVCMYEHMHAPTEKRCINQIYEQAERPTLLVNQATDFKAHSPCERKIWL